MWSHCYHLTEKNNFDKREMKTEEKEQEQRWRHRIATQERSELQRWELDDHPSNVSLSLSGCPSGVMVKAMDCGIVVSEFVLQSRYYVDFGANILGKGMNPLILPAMG